jgi:hypothetical protein
MKPQAPQRYFSGRLQPHAYFLSLFSVAVVVFVPSLCCVVVLSLEWPVDGFWVDVLLLFCPSGFSVVVVLELVWAKPAPLRAKLSPMANAAIVVFERMVFLLFKLDTTQDDQRWAVAAPTPAPPRPPTIAPVPAPRPVAEPIAAPPPAPSNPPVAARVPILWPHAVNDSTRAKAIAVFKRSSF